MVLHNPYAPPQQPGSFGPDPSRPSPADVRLFGPAAIAAHSILLSPLVGVTLAAINHWRLRDRAAFRRTVLAYGIPTVLLLVFAMGAVPARLSTLMRFVTFLWSISVATQLHREHSVLVERHLAAGGKKARWWLATLVVLGVVVLASIAIVTVTELRGAA